MRDADLVATYLGAFLGWAANNSPNDAIAANTRRSAEAMCAAAREEGRQEERERCAKEISWLRRLIQWCSTRLRHGPYRESLRLRLAGGPTEPDLTPIVRSRTPSEPVCKTLLRDSG
jgi:hypothetical protein